VKSHLFYKEENLELTALGKIPKDWPVVSIGDVAETTSGGTPSRAKKEYYGGSIPWVKSGELKDNIIDYTEETVTDEGLRNSSAKLFQKGTLLVALYGATVGKTGILGIDATTNQAICAIMPKQNKLDPNYLRFQITARRNELISASSGGAQPNISQGIIRGFRIPLPTVHEQHKIAATLSLVDEAVRKTNEIISNIERLKKGLMQQLLTRGIGHKEFKDTEIGRIPKEWKVVRLENYIDLLTGYPFRSQEFSTDTNGVRLVRGINITRGRLRWEEDITKYWKSITRDLDKYLVQKSDLLIGMDGALVGKNYALASENDLPMLLVQRVARLRAKNGLNQRYLFYLIGSPSFVNYVNKVNTSSGIAHISSTQINNFKIPWAPPQEQEKIARMLSAVDKKIELERMIKSNLEKAKLALMNLLLTGKIRIRVD
jgi:type I restriction enzyme S subunit